MRLYKTQYSFRISGNRGYDSNRVRFTAVDAFVTQYYRTLVCTAFYYGWFDVYCLYKFSKYIPCKLSIEKQRSIVDAWGIDLQNDI